MLAIALVLAMGAIAAAPAASETLPPFDGLMAFPAIDSPADPEEYSWEVKLGEDEELRAIDETHAGVYWVGTEELAMTITAQKAHDADGATVPTTLAVTPPNVVTLTVHHRAGNPAAGGAPFVYPVVAGAGWEGGFQTSTVQMPPPTEQAVVQPPPRPCTVPKLKGQPLKLARVLLKKGNCKLGEIRGERMRDAKVIRQFPRPGQVRPAGTEIDVKVEIRPSRGGPRALA